MSQSCIFCAIVAGTIAADVLYQDGRVVAFRDRSPQAPVHILLVTRHHFASIDDPAVPADAAACAALFAAGQAVARQVGVERNGYRLVMNHGSDGGQTVQHLHAHLLAGRSLGWPPG
ncbi:MAG: HIT domain-containing protein [Chloroflexi bacterium]|nr:HIT domain-containing protein [Chloroflexota bacterium]